MRQDRRSFIDADCDARQRIDAFLEHLVADRRLHLESRVGSCAYGIRWRFGDDGWKRVCGEQDEWEGED